MQVVFFVNSGTEANELAMMMARLYTGNHDMISVRNGYVGNSANTMGLTGQSKWKFNIVQVCKLKPYMWKLLLESKEISVFHGCLGLKESSETGIQYPQFNNMKVMLNIGIGCNIVCANACVFLIGVIRALCT